MAEPVSLPPPGFEELTLDEKLQYVQHLWDYVVADPSEVPVPGWHRHILHERLAAYNAGSHEGNPWPEVGDQLLRDLADRKRGQD